MTPEEALADEQVRELAQQILARVEYARLRPADEDVVRRIADWIADALGWITRLYVESPVLWFALFIGLMLTGLALLAHIVWSVRVALRANALEALRPHAAGAPRFDLEAERLAGSGRMLEAAHAMHIACIERLLQGGVLQLQRHDPNRTLRNRIGSAPLAPALRFEFMRLLDELEVRWFRDRGSAPRDRELFEEWRSLHARLEAPEAA